MGLRTKGAISSFVQSGNFECLTLKGFEPVTLRIAVGHLTTIPNFNISTNFFLPNFITQRCLMIKHNLKLIDFLVKYTIKHYVILKFCKILKDLVIRVGDYDPGGMSTNLISLVFIFPLKRKE